jgi:hypothetical protein
MSFEQYSSKGKPVKNHPWYGCTAFFTRIPIEYLDQFRAAYPGVYRIRYRGPRFNTPSAKYRGSNSKQSTCLKEDATHFSVYSY